MKSAKNHLYVFEGVDGTGKTSLAKGLAKNMGGIYYKGLPKILKPFKDFVDKKLPANLRFYFYKLGNRIAYREIKNLLKNNDVFVDQYVYCTIAFHIVSMKDKSIYFEPKIVPDKIIYLIANWEEVDKRLNERQNRKALEELEYLKSVDEEYKLIFSRMNNVMYFNNMQGNLEDNIIMLKNTIN